MFNSAQIAQAQAKQKAVPWLTGAFLMAIAPHYSKIIQFVIYMYIHINYDEGVEV